MRVLDLLRLGGASEAFVNGPAMRSTRVDNDATVRQGAVHDNRIGSHGVG